MDLILFAIDFILHVDVHLKELFENYGVWVYAILFLIIFCETGLVVTPFLPGDSLLFAAGALTVGSGYLRCPTGLSKRTLLFILTSLCYKALGAIRGHWDWTTSSSKQQ